MVDYFFHSQLLEECTIKLDLNSAARRVFLSNGREAFESKDIPHNVDVYISNGEPFMDPFKNMKGIMLGTCRKSFSIDKDNEKSREQSSLCGNVSFILLNSIRPYVFLLLT